MGTLSKPIPTIQGAKHGGALFISSHALQRMMERRITVDQLEQALDCSEVEVLENYPQVGRPSSACLILGMYGNGDCVHVVVSYPTVEIITVYPPTPPKWVNPRQRGR